MFKRARIFGFTAAILSGVGIYLLGFTFGEYQRSHDRNLTFAQGYQAGYLKAEVKYNMVLRDSNEDLNPFSQ